MSNQHPRYLAFMLRLWRAKTDGVETWRASLESAQTGERRGFENLETLFAFLKQATNEDPQCKKATQSQSDYEN